MFFKINFQGNRGILRTMYTYVHKLKDILGFIKFSDKKAVIVTYVLSLQGISNIWKICLTHWLGLLQVTIILWYKSNTHIKGLLKYRTNKWFVIFNFSATISGFQCGTKEYPQYPKMLHSSLSVYCWDFVYFTRCQTLLFQNDTQSVSEIL